MVCGVSGVGEGVEEDWKGWVLIIIAGDGYDPNTLSMKRLFSFLSTTFSFNGFERARWSLSVVMALKGGCVQQINNPPPPGVQLVPRPQRSHGERIWVRWSVDDLSVDVCWYARGWQ